MAALKRNGGTWVLILLLAGGFFLLREKRSLGAGPAGPAATGICPDCDTSPGSTTVLTTTVNLNPGGTYSVPGNLDIVFPGRIICNDAGATGNNGCDITVNVGGNMTMGPGTFIDADNKVNGGHGGTILIKVCGNLTMEGPGGGQPGAVITSQHLGSGTDDGGKITVFAGCVTLDVNGNPVCGQPQGDIVIETGAKITANSNTHRGGDIELYAGHNILIQGSVTSQGTGGTGHGGLITIDACCDLKVDDTGLVSSRGLDPGPDRVHLQACTVEIFGLVESSGPAHQGPSPNCTPPIRPDRDPNSAACVEIWSGTTLLVDATGTHHGQVNADVGQSGGTTGRGWIDALANGNITIIGNPGVPYNAGGNLDVNTLPFTPPSPFVPWALHANMVLQNGFGGAIAVQSRFGNVTTYDTTTLAFSRAIQANASTGNNGGRGGQVLVQAFGTAALGQSSIQAMGDTTGGGSQRGGLITVLASNGSVTGGPSPGQLDAAGPSTSATTGTINLFGCTGTPYNGDEHAVVINDPAAGHACAEAVDFPSPADTAVFPSANCSTNCGQITPTPTPTATTTSLITHTVTPTPGICNKSEVISALAGHIPDTVVRLDLGGSIQAAVTAASDTNGDGFVIVLVVKDGTGQLGGHTNQRVTVSRNDYGHPFQLFGCSVTMHDPNRTDGLPTGWVTAGAGGANTIFLMDLHGADSEVAGWKVDGNGRTVRNTGGSGSPVGIWFNGNSNIMHNGAGSGNGIGLRIDGNSNIATDTDLFSNTSHGAQVIGNNNQLLKLDAGDLGKGNGGDGINVNGTGNLIQECDAYDNTFNGISSTGGNNTLNKNNAGDRGKGNHQKGFVIGGSGIVKENSAKGNTSYGFDITSNGHTLTNNTSGGTGSGEPNGTCQYNFVAGNTNNGGNRSNGVLLVGAFALGCVN